MYEEIIVVEFVNTYAYVSAYERGRTYKLHTHTHTHTYEEMNAFQIK